MQWKSKVRFAFSFAAILAASVANAIPRAPCDKIPEDVCCEEPKPGPFAFAYPKDIGLICPRDFYISADLLIFQAKQNGLDFAMVNNVGDQSANSISPSNDGLAGGIVKGYSSDCKDWDWDLGARVNLGFYLNHDAWNFDLAWTYFHYTTDTSSVVKGSGRMLPFWLVPQAFPGAADGVLPEREASAQWEMHYNTFDISLGKPHHISRYVIFNPHFGLRAAWVDQCYLARYGGSFTNTEATTQLGAEMEASNDFWSVGLRAGVQTEWLLGSGWTIFGNAAGSLLYTKFEIDQSVSQGNLGYGFDDDFKQNIANMELLLGIGWGTLFCKQQYRFSLRAAYEFHQWWNVNHMRRLFSSTTWSANDKVSRGDLTLNGVSIRVMFDF
jgi:Legionella pneumophila major outer membrane protein precursor